MTFILTFLSASSNDTPSKFIDVLFFTFSLSEPEFLFKTPGNGNNFASEYFASSTEALGGKNEGEGDVRSSLMLAESAVGRRLGYGEGKGEGGISLEAVVVEPFVLFLLGARLGDVPLAGALVDGVIGNRLCDDLANAEDILENMLPPDFLRVLTVDVDVGAYGEGERRDLDEGEGDEEI
jgi:hypothetical protein